MKLFSKLNNLILLLFAALAKLKPFPSRSKIEGISLYVRTVIICVLLAFVWASFAQVDRVVRVSGKIIPAGRGREIQHLEGGIVASIQATEGAAVKKGDLLLTIDNIVAGASLGETKVKLNAQRARAIRLEAEVKGLEDVVFPDDISNEASAEAEKNLFLSRRLKLRQEILVHEETFNQQAAKLNEISSRKQNLLGELTVAHSRSKLMEDMALRSSASKLEVLEAQSRERRLETEINDATSSIPTLNAAIAEEKARKKALQAEFVNTAQGDLVATLSEVARLEKVMLSDSDRFKRTEIRAPIDGIINRISINTLGGVVKPGDKLIELIPYADELLIEAQAQPKDRGYLKPGLDATVRISAYDVGELGVLKSKVIEVSADTMVDSHGESFYRVNLLVSSLPKSYKNHMMVPGMTATADVVTGSRTVMGLLLSPIRKFTYSIFRDSL